MKKVLLITNIFPPHIGGPATFIDKLAHGLVGKGYRVTVICSSDRDSDDSDQYRPFKVRRVSLAIREIYEIKIRLVLFWEMLFHRNIFVNGLELYTYHIARLLGRSFVLKIVGDTVWEMARNAGTTMLNIDDFQKDSGEQNENNIFSRRRNKYVNYARKIVTPSDYLRRMVIGWGADPARVLTIPNGIENEWISCSEPLRRSSKKMDVIFVGRLTNWKGVETLLLALMDVENIYATVIGDGPEYPHLVELSRQLMLTDKVRFLGRQSQEKVIHHLSRAHVLVLTSLYEGLSHTLLEAFSMGIPCIASDCGGNREVVVQGENGLLVFPQDVKALRTALVKLLSDEDLRFRLACGAKSSANKFRLSETVSQVANLMIGKA